MTKEESFEAVKNFANKCDDPMLFGVGSYGDFFLYFDQSIIQKRKLIFWCDWLHQNYNCKRFADHFKIDCCIVGCNQHISMTEEYNMFFRKVCDFLSEKNCNSLIQNYNYNIIKRTKIVPAKNHEMYKSNTSIIEKLPSNYFIICPHGSVYYSPKRRFFYRSEFDEIARLAQKNDLSFILCCTTEQLRVYDPHRRYNHLKFESFNNEKISIADFLTVLQNSKFVISPDTGLKTLSCNANKTTLILKNRDENDNYINIGMGKYDFAFLNKITWNNQIFCTFEEILWHIKEFSVKKIINNGLKIKMI